jgi:predicted nucleic acid-binding protein
MTSGSKAFLVDTNVLVYAYDPIDGDKRERAIEVLESLGPHQLGSVSTQILGSFFVTAAGLNVQKSLMWLCI